MINWEQKKKERSGISSLATKNMPNLSWFSFIKVLDFEK